MSTTSYLSFDVGIRNLAFCLFTYDETTHAVSLDQWNVVELCAKNEGKKMSLCELCRRLIEALDDGSFTSDVHVIIENQPVLKNPKMKSVQTMLFTYFVMLGCKHITLFSARNKLKAYDGPPVEVTVKSSYLQRKKLSIAYCAHYVKDVEKYASHFNASRKKDDLADCFMQGLSFLTKTRKTSVPKII